MKKLFFAFMAFATLLSVSCTKDDETSLKGRWEAPRMSDMPDDIAFVALFGEQDLDLYIIAWGQHLKGTYTWNNDVVTYHITEASQAYTNVSYDEQGNMATWEWMAGNLDASTLTLASGYSRYPMTDEELARAREDFGSFTFKVDGTTATSTLVGIENLTFNKVN
jgi:hypothetical protein